MCGKLCTKPLFSVPEGVMQHCRGHSGSKVVFTLFRYLSKCCSDIVDIVPLKRYTIS